ncbi:MAG TPA: ABC transporter ATP-binding protein [Anaerolineaceae bacterium]|nr:ABC transporter ATP-binding protein [Anaerolineaceae bacterium]
MILANGLTKRFADLTAVDHVSFEVNSGKVLALLGPNGAGKTTTVRMLTSILTPTSGTAQVAGFDVVAQPEQVRAAVGVLTEHHGLYGRMNALEYLGFFAQVYKVPKAEADQRITALLQEFGLFEARSKRTGEYSKGMRQKLALVRTLLHRPPVLLLDEPTSAMDPESARMVRDAIHRLRSEERTILLCTHNLVEAEELADEIAIIRRGKIILKDTPRNVKEHLLGPVEFKAQFAQPLNGRKLEFPQGVTLLEAGKDWLRFQITNPEVDNPRLLRYLLDSQLDVITFSELERSLEQAYLQAVLQQNGEKKP